MAAPVRSGPSNRGIETMNSNSGNAAPSHESTYLPALVVLTSLFFMWGFITSLNDILIPHLKAIFTLSYVQAILIQFSFFGAYFVMSVASGITLLQVAANPYVTILGPSDTAASRLNLTQAFNSLGTTVGPFLGSMF